MNQESGIRNIYNSLFFAVVFLLSSPLISFAAISMQRVQLPGCNLPPQTFYELMCVITNNILSPLIPILITLALIAFFWGVAKYVIHGADDEKAREQGKQIMLWGIVGLFVMISVWGLVILVQDTFDLEKAYFKSSDVKIPGR